MTFPTSGGERCLFTLLPDRDRYDRGTSLGTAFATMAGTRLVTAAHVVKSSDRCIALNRTVSPVPLKARVLHIDDEFDLAILAPDEPLVASLQLADLAGPPALTPVFVWDWPDQDSPLGRGLTPQVHHGLTLWCSDSPREIPFVGHGRHGMSGGPLVQAETGAVLGVLVRIRTGIDPDEVVDTWWDWAERSGTTPAGDSDLLIRGMKDQLRLSYGLAVPAARLRLALDLSNLEDT